MMQLELQLLPPQAKAITLNGMVLEILKIAEWWTPAEIQRVLLRQNEMHSDSSITARLRDLRKDAYGAWVIEKRKRENSRAWEYSLKGKK
jgi:hypothetical protein